MLVVALVVLVLFAWVQITARAELPSYYSGTNFAVSAVMVLILFILASFTTLTVSINESYLRIKFSYGFLSRKFALNQIASVRTVRNHWYYGWGVRIWFWPYMWIYNISGFEAVEIILKNGRVYRIGTDVPQEFEMAIKKAINS